MTKTTYVQLLFISFILLSSCGSKPYVYIEPKPLASAKNVTCTQKEFIKRCEFDIDMAAQDVIQIYRNDMEKNGWNKSNSSINELRMDFIQSNKAYDMQMIIEPISLGGSHVIYAIKFLPGL